MPLYEVTIRGTYLDQAINNVRRWLTANPAPSIQTFVNNLGARLVTDYLSICSDELRLEDMVVRLLDTPSPGLAYVPATWPAGGDLGDQATASHIAVAFSLRGTNPVYPFRGSFRLAGITEPDVHGNDIVALALPNWQNAGEAFVSVVSDGTGVGWFSVLSTETYPTPNVIASVTVDPIIGSQTSRRAGHGA